MPKLYSAISEQTDHIYDVVSKQFAHKLIRDLNPLSKIGDKIYIDTGYSATQSTTDGAHNSILRNNKFFIKALPNTNPTQLKWDSLTGQHVTGQYVNSRTMYNQFPIIYADKAVDIYLHEMTLPTTLTLECNLSLVSRDQAYEIPSQLFRRFAHGQVYNETVTFDYPIPNDMLTMLFSLYRMRRLEKSLTFPEYINICSRSKFTYNASRVVDGNIEIVVPKTLINCMVTLEYNEDKPEEMKVNRSANSYEVKFNLSAQFERPDMMVLVYPPVVDNVLVPNNMIVPEKTVSPIESLDGPFPIKSYHDFQQNYSMIRSTQVKMPFYDDFLMPPTLAQKRSYREFLTAIFLIDETATDQLTKIELGGSLGGETEHLHDIVKEVLKMQGDESFGTDGIFHIEIFWGSNTIEPSLLHIDEDLNVYVPCKDIHKIHRIVISEITDLKYLNPKWLPYLIGKCPYFQLCPIIDDLMSKGLLTTSGDTVTDPKKNILGGTDDSYWPLRIIRADIIAKHSLEGNRQSTAR